RVRPVAILCEDCERYGDSLAGGDGDVTTAQKFHALRKISSPSNLEHLAAARLLVQCRELTGRRKSAGRSNCMHIAQVAPLTEAIPPKLYGGTERVVSWLTEE